jgi:2-phosphoglycerate kinase
LAKTFVVKETTGERVPLLRGVLVQSLVTAGLSFQDAYLVAQVIRSELQDLEEVTTAALRTRVSKILKKRFGAGIGRAYELGPEATRQTVVRTPVREGPFSLETLSRSLRACAIEHRQASKTARTIQESLRKDACSEIDHLQLRRMVYRCLEDQASPAAAERYLSWRQFKDSGEPLILLAGGVSGTGKSTITTELAYRLKIVRTQSTDMMREIIRCYLAPDEVPTLAFSSFEAWRGLASQGGRQPRAVVDDATILGFLAQFETVKRGLEATVARAVKERHDLIVDGVHVLPTELDLREASQESVMVSVMLVIETKEMLTKRLRGRGKEQPGRKASRYLEHLDQIWELQSHLLGLADRAGIPIVSNWNVEDTVLEILKQVSHKVGERFPPDPRALG